MNKHIVTQANETPTGQLELRTIAMPADTNANGDIFGGWLLAEMDKAGGIIAGRIAQGRVATIAIDAMKFVRPVHIGDVVCVYADLKKIGRTSMTIALEAWVLRGRYKNREKVTEGIFTFVAIDENGQARQVPPQLDPIEG